jgi:long-chain fatty acid transport protein
VRLFDKLMALLSVISAAASSAAFGGGFAIFEQGAKAVGMGNAFAATADDPSAIFYNVAGIAQQRRPAVLAGGNGITFGNEFRGDPNDAWSSGQTGHYRRHLFVPPNAYAILPVGNEVTLGVGVFSSFGLRTNWAQPWAGRFVSQDANVKAISVEPAIAWQSSGGHLAFGIGGEYRCSHIILSRNSPALNPFNGRIVDIANAYLDSDWNSAWGYNVGFLFKPGQTWRVGAAYRSHIKINYTGGGTFTQIPTGNPQLDALVAKDLPPNQRLTTSIDFPATASFGIATTAVGKWTLEADLINQTWSRFKSLDVIFSQTPTSNLHRIENWKNCWSYMVGGNRRVSDAWEIRLGALYDRNPEPTSVVGPLLPDADRLGATFGIGYEHGPFVVDATEFVLHFKTRSTEGVSSDNFNGTYKTDANIVSVNLGYKF